VAPGVEERDPREGGQVTDRVPESAVALLLAVLAALVIADSLRVGIGWGDDGPRSGYFPFGIGVALLAASVWTALRKLRGWRSSPRFATRTQLAGVFAVLLPMGAYVGLIVLIGIYVSSAAMIGWFMWRHGRHKLGTTLATAIGAPIVFFLVFERWFLVPLPKGPLERLLGF
jgi:hypothetical protein